MQGVFNDLKPNNDSLCYFGNNTAVEHIQLLNMFAHLFMIWNVCYFYYFSPMVYCVHVRENFSVVLVNKAYDDKEVSGSIWILLCSADDSSSLTQ